MGYYYVSIKLVCNDVLSWKPYPNERQLLKAQNQEEAFSEAISLYEDNKANNFLFSQDIFSCYCESDKISDENIQKLKQQLQKEYPQEINILELHEIKFLFRNLETGKIESRTSPQFYIL
ncbi:hypothetical protein IPN41_03255 [Candidatus Falkowbacteria bacterium]|nr:MAG: hypothetical protein IPN41_03255 [Candidatus Falkowbacteria bacterium]